MTLRAALVEGMRLLEEAGVPAARLTAEVLLTHAVKCGREHLYSHPEEELSEMGWIHYGRFLYERIRGKPTQYITLEQEFYGRLFEVSPAVLIPRPETEHVVESILRLARPDAEMVDVGCGSGAIGVSLALERPRAKVWATDISREALEVAARNAGRLGARVHFLQCDLLSAVRSASMDVVASNPPYVPEGERESLQVEVRDYEPAVALYGGATGHEVYARLAPEAARVLRPGGMLVLELGYQSLEAVRGMLDSRWSNVEEAPDLAGIPRVLAARYQP